MSDERQKLEVIDYLYGELDADRTRALLREAADDPELAADLRSLQSTRALYQQAPLPEPSVNLSEAILRQEKILRAQPESFWAPLVRLFTHPAFGAAGIVVVAVGAGLVYTLSQPTPLPTSPALMETLHQTPSPAPAKSPGGGAGFAAAAPTPAKQDGFEFNADEALAARDKAADGDALDLREQGAARAGAAPKPEAPHALGTSYRTTSGAKKSASADFEKPAMSNKLGDFAGERERKAGPAQQRSVADGLARPSTPVPADDAEEQGAAQMMAPVAKAEQRKDAVATKSATVFGSAGQLTEPSAMQQQASPGEPLAGAAGNVAPPPATGSIERGEQLPSVQSVASEAKRQAIPAPMSQDALEAFRAKAGKRAQDALNAGSVAFETGHYLEAYDQFKLAEKLDRDKKLAPVPQVMQARALYAGRRWRDASLILEQVLASYPKYEKRDQLHWLVINCYTMLDDSAQLATATKRQAREMDATKRAAKAKSAQGSSAADVEPAEAAPTNAAPANAQ